LFFAENILWSIFFLFFRPGGDYCARVTDCIPFRKMYSLQCIIYYILEQASAEGWPWQAVVWYGKATMSLWSWIPQQAGPGNSRYSVAGWGRGWLVRWGDNVTMKLNTSAGWSR
jgi:hypothetical protein